MCGIIAMFSAWEPVSKSSLMQGIDCLNHRGPDGAGYWISPDQHVGLGHTRLSIIDLTHGQQPISNQDESLQIIVNGEFYEYESIQADLRKRGYQFKTNADSEIALHLYAELGTHCLHELRGEFAFSLWDTRNKLLFAARDRFGIKPLYYSYYKNTLYIASEVKAILAAGVPAKWDFAAFWNLEQGLLPPDRTLFADIFQVPPGHFLIASPAGIKLHKYWDFNYPRIDASRVKPISPDEYIEQVRQSLDDAIKVRLRADVPIACYLSGGLDSSTLLGMASRHISKPIQSFTLAFDDEGYNEVDLARETAAFTGADLNIIPISQADLAEHFSDSIWHSEMPSINAGSTAKYILSRAARKAGYKVVLTGEGSDEVFAGYPHFRQDMLLYNQQGQDEQTIAALLEELKLNNAVSSGLLLAEGSFNESLNVVQRLLGFVPSWISVCAEGFSKSSSLYAKDFSEQFAQSDTYRQFFNAIDIIGQLANREPVHQSLYLWSKTMLPNYLFRLLGDGVEMANSIEGRLPFLDHKLVEMLVNIPVALKINGMTEKYILKEAAKPFITNTMYQRQKHPFLAPPSTFKPNEPMQQLIQDTLRSSGMAKIPFYNHYAIIELLNYLPKIEGNQRAAVDLVLTKLLSVYFLQERFKLV